MSEQPTTLGPDLLKQQVNTLRSLADKLTLPKTVRGELEKIGKLEMLLMQLNRDKPNHTAMVDAIISQLATDDAALATEALYPARIAAVEEAVRVQMNAALATVQANARDVMVAIRETLWQPAMDQVLAVAEKVTPKDDPASLMRSDRPEVAAEWVQAERALGAITAARELSESLFGAPMQSGNNAFNSGALNQFTRPDLAAKVWDSERPMQSMVAAIHAGAGPRLVTAAQADAERSEFMKIAAAQHAEDMRSYLPPFPVN